jgi:hypothetical protein
MRVKTFTGIDPTELDNQVNVWLAVNRVIVRHASMALRPLRDKGPDALTGKTKTRRGMALRALPMHRIALVRPTLNLPAVGGKLQMLAPSVQRVLGQRYTNGGMILRFLFSRLC